MARLPSAAIAVLFALPAWALTVNAAIANALVTPGVSQALAQWRASQYSNVAYELDLTLDANRVRGIVRIALDRRSPEIEVVLDWRQPTAQEIQGKLLAVRVDGKNVDGAVIDQDHIVISSSAFTDLRAVIEVEIDVPIAAAGTGITRYRDAVDGVDYVYSLFVPADASTVFPCFDQPDLKARFALQLSMPESWSAFSNARAAFIETTPEARKSIRFAASEPISTYLFAFAAGPFEVVATSEAGVRLIARKSRVDRARDEAPSVLALNDAAVRYFSEYFAQPFPFAKYDLILIPEFPYGGMEHAGATFLREDAILFPSPPTDNDRLRRALLIFHETAHQWFGDLVTMRWFDDLWLKEGFANYMAAKAAEAIIPETAPWVQFHSRKTEAYRTDATQGTIAIHQPMDNLSSAKSAYGNIVYNKAPAVLRVAEKYLGEGVFIEAVRTFVREHAYAAADWRALVGAFERASGEDLRYWAKRWVDTAGMPEIRVRWWHVHGRIASMRIEARDPTGEHGVWPQRLSVMLGYEDDVRHVQEVTMGAVVIDVPDVIGLPAPSWVVANARDFGYGRFLMEPNEVRAALSRVAILKDPLERAQIWEALWEAVREAQLDPEVYLRHALVALPRESNPTLQTTLLARVQWTYRHYLSTNQQAAVAAEVETTLLGLTRQARNESDRIAMQRAFIGMASSVEARGVLKAWLRDDDLPGGVELSLRDRFRAVATLLTRGDADGEGLLDELRDRKHDDAAARYHYATRAASADRSRKAEYVASWLNDASISEAWIEEALPALNAPEHAKATAPLFRQAIEALPRLANERKIFFVNRWLDAFVAGQESEESIRVLREVSARSDLGVDIRRKLLEAEDMLVRKVKIRAAFDDAK